MEIQEKPKPFLLSPVFTDERNSNRFFFPNILDFSLCFVPQVSDLTSKLGDMRQYWIQLPLALCSKLAAGGNGQDKCWNGITKAR